MQDVMVTHLDLVPHTGLAAVLQSHPGNTNYLQHDHRYCLGVTGCIGHKVGYNDTGNNSDGKQDTAAPLIC